MVSPSPSRRTAGESRGSPRAAPARPFLALTQAPPARCPLETPGAHAGPPRARALRGETSTLGRARCRQTPVPKPYPQKTTRGQEPSEMLGHYRGRVASLGQDEHRAWPQRATRARSTRWGLHQAPCPPAKAPEPVSHPLRKHLPPPSLPSVPPRCHPAPPRGGLGGSR